MTPSKALRLAGTVLASLALVAAIIWVNRAIPTKDEEVGNIKVTGKAGEPVDAGDFVVTVHGVQVAKRVAESKEALGDQEAKTTQGLFVVVDATVTMTQEAGPPREAVLVNGERRYDHTSRLTTWDTLVADNMEPGIARRGPIVFEIPDDPGVLSGAEFHMALRGASRLAGEASVDLGLDEAAAESLRAKAPARLELREVNFG